MSLVLGVASIGTAHPAERRVCGRRVDGGAAARDLRLRGARGRGRDFVDRRVGRRSPVRPGDRKGTHPHRASRRRVVDGHALCRWSRRPPERALGGGCAGGDGRVGGRLLHEVEQPRADPDRALGRFGVDTGEEPERRSAGRRRPERRGGARGRRRLGRRRLRTRRARPDPHRTLGRDGVDDRAEPEQRSVPELPVGVAAIAPDDIWAVGTWFTKAFDDRTLTLHWDGTAWRRCRARTPGRHRLRTTSCRCPRLPPTTSGRWACEV